MGANFRDVVKRMRLAAGLSQTELASRLGTTQSAIARWESGDVSPRLVTLERIANACGLDVHVIWALRLADARSGQAGQAERSEDVDRNQIRWHLSLTPRQRLETLLDMLAFEERAHRARRVLASDWQDPVIEAYKKDIDRTLLRENLKLTVEQRLKQHQQLAEFAAKFRGVLRKRA